MRTERRILTLVLGGCALILGVSLTTWLFTQFERVNERITLPPSLEARRNPLLAAERFLTRLEIEVRTPASGAGLCTLPPAGATLVIDGLRPLCPGGTVDLRAWIASGGRVVTTPPAGHDGGGVELLERLGIHTRPVEQIKDADPTRLDLSPDTAPFHIDFAAARVLVTDNKRKGRQAWAEQGHLVQHSLGRGELLVLSSLSFMRNRAIGEHDHARFTAWLSLPRTPDAQVWLVRAPGTGPALAELLWSLVPEALIAAAVLLGVWLWSLGARLGPREVAPGRQRRDLLEHLDASAAFLWRQGQFTTLMATTRRALQRRWAQRLPHDSGNDPRAWIEPLARASGASPEALTRALLSIPDSPRDCLVQAQHLHHLWHAARHSASAPTRPPQGVHRHG